MIEQIQNAKLDYKISTVIENFKNRSSFNNKADVLNLIMSLKESLEFNTNINWEKLCNELGFIYNDPSPIYQRPDYTPDPIDPTTMSSSDVFVFGSNTDGAHIGGAAKAALDHYDAKYGQAKGLQGRSYAIITKDLNIGDKSIPLDEIQKQIDEFLEFAYSRPDLTFWMTKIGCLRAGYTIAEIGQLFANKVIPRNVVMPREFVNIVHWYNYLYSPSKEIFYELVSDREARYADTKNLGIGKIEHKDVLQTLPKDIVPTDYDGFISATKQIVNLLFKKQDDANI